MTCPDCRIVRHQAPLGQMPSPSLEKIELCRKHAGTDALLEAAKTYLELMGTRASAVAYTALVDAIDACEEPRCPAQIARSPAIHSGELAEDRDYVVELCPKHAGVDALLAIATEARKIIRGYRMVLANLCNPDDRRTPVWIETEMDRTESWLEAVRHYMQEET